jgi:hypothetical protein
MNDFCEKSNKKKRGRFEMRTTEGGFHGLRHAVLT